MPHDDGQLLLVDVPYRIESGRRYFPPGADEDGVRRVRPFEMVGCVEWNAGWRLCRTEDGANFGGDCTRCFSDHGDEGGPHAPNATTDGGERPAGPFASW
jgi:hypothetical protein